MTHAQLRVAMLGLLAGGFFVILATSAVAQSVQADRAPHPRATAVDSFSAVEAVRQALTDNPMLQATQQQEAAAQAAVREARSGWFPTIQGEASYRRLSDNIDYTVDIPSIPGTGGQQVTFAPAIRNRYTTQATVQQPLFTGFRVSNQLDAAQAETRSASARVRATRHDVAFQTRSAYWRLYEARTRRRASEQSLRLIERQLVDVRNQRDVGRATDADVLRVKARRDRVRAERIGAQNEAQSIRRRLNDLMGRPLDAAVALADTVQLFPSTADGADLVERATESRPDLEALRQTVQARAARLDVAQSDWFPQIFATGSYLYARPNEQLFPPEDQFQGTWAAGLRLSWSLSVGGQTDAAADRARAQWQQARYELQDRREAVEAEVNNQVEAVAEARESVVAGQTSLESAREAYRSVQSRFDEGMVVVSDLLDAERTLRQARTQLAAAQANYALAEAALARALGRDPLD